MEFQVPFYRTKRQIYRHKKHHGPSGVKPQLHQKWYYRELLSLLYADGAGVIFSSREELTRGFPILYKHFARFGLLIHVGRQVKDIKTGEITWGKSKTEIMYIPPF